MLSYCLKCRKNTESKNQRVVSTTNGILILFSNYAVCNSQLGIRTPLRKILPLGDILFMFNKLFLIENKFMSEIQF